MARTGPGGVALRPLWLSLERPLVMGIVTSTPDSFSDGGDHDDPLARSRGASARDAGADIIDVGGESTRPGSDAVPAAEELARVRPVVARWPHAGVPVSVDTRQPEVAAACVQAGASIVNDVSGFRDPAMVDVAAATDVGVVVMHMLGEPKTMQRAPAYADVVAEVGGFLLAQAALLEAAGVAQERIAIDPGIGFGKTIEHNLALLRGLPELASHGYPVVVGASRKRFIGDITGEDDARKRSAARSPPPSRRAPRRVGRAGARCGRDRAGARCGRGDRGGTASVERRRLPRGILLPERHNRREGCFR